MGDQIRPYYANFGTTLFDGVFLQGKMRAGTNETATYYTKKLEPGQDFPHDCEVVTIQDNVEYRVMNPILSKLAASIHAGIKKIYVGPGSNVLYVPGDDSCAFTISYLSDIVGKDGMVFVAAKQDLMQNNNFIGLLNTRSNVQFVAVGNTTHQDSAAVCKNSIDNFGKKIDVLFCDVGYVDQAHRFVHDNFENNQAVVPDVSIFLSEQAKLQECRFIRLFNVVTITSLVPEWCCAVGSFYHP
ncbi:mediator of RNA polymerase II transcription subunit 36a [Artemisia annua]|uniref:Mediator of RNA polymerase II transcription subunit 36a n=1 Tax=Artemisia annua TaxID=35608 RepID=A0A2U1QPB9_ARTAN|nr:mediator of RNA polymerase II transcription subunit 36a [Artemisia annua]